MKSEPSQNRQDRLLFLGNRQQCVPEALLLARNLSPRDKLTWQLLRLSASDNPGGLFPPYDTLQRWLSDYPDREKASRSTVSHALTMLRLTRWLSLRQRLRHVGNGQVTGNLYALHDAPLSLADACRMDESYPTLLDDCTRHSNKRIRTTAITLLLTGEQPVESGRLCTESPFKTELSLKIRLSKKNQSLKTGLSDVARAGGQTEVLCVHTDTDIHNKSKKSTPELRWPVDNPFSQGECRAAERAMQGLDTALGQQVLDDCFQRLAQGDIRRPLAYLLGMVDRAGKGEFNRLRRRRGRK